MTISGRVETPGMALSLHAEGPERLSGYQVISHPDGSFAARHVPPGTYVLEAQGQEYGEPKHPLMARLPLTVGWEDVGGIVLQARQVQTMKLHYRMIGTDGNEELMELTLRPATDSGIPLQDFGERDGSRAIGGLVPGHYGIDVINSSSETVREAKGSDTGVGETWSQGGAADWVRCG